MASTSTQPSDSTTADGPAFVLIGSADDKPMCRNPFANHRELLELCPGYTSAKLLRSGRLLVKTSTQAETRRLLDISHFREERVVVEIADRLSSCQGLIHSPDLVGMSDTDILGELSSQGVTEASRLRSDTGDNPLVRLRFRGFHLPPKVICGYLSLPVKQWVDLPRQCRRCWKHGHGQRSCRHPAEICGFCSASNEHPTDQCPSGLPTCALCSEAHPAWDRRNCGVWRRLRQKVQERTAAPPAPTPPEPMGPSWPALPSPPRPSAAPQPLAAQTLDSASQTDDPPVAPPPLATDAGCQTDAPLEAPPTRAAGTNTPSRPPTGRTFHTQTPVRRSCSVFVQATSCAATTTSAAQTETPPARTTADAAVQYVAPRIRIYSTTSESAPSSPDSVASYRTTRDGPVTRSAAATASRFESESGTPSPTPSEAENIAAVPKALPDPAKLPPQRRPLVWRYSDGEVAQHPVRLYLKGQEVHPVLSMYSAARHDAKRGNFYDMHGDMLYIDE